MTGCDPLSVDDRDGRLAVRDTAQIRPVLEDWHEIQTRGLIQQRSVRHDVDFIRPNLVRPRDTK